MKHLQKTCCLLVGILLIIVSCRNPMEQTTFIADEFTIDVVKVIGYEVETVTTRIAEESTASEISQIRAMPAIDRTAIKYGIDKYGATEIFIDILEPEQQLPADDIPPNTFVEAKHIHIVHGLGSFYDANRNLLYTQPMDGTNIAQVEEFAAKQEDVDKMLETAQANGAIINDLGNGFISVRMSNSLVNSTSTNESTANTYTVTIFNKLTNTPIGSVIYDNSDKMLFRMYAQTITKPNGDSELKATQQEVFDLNPTTNLTTIIKTNSVYSNLKIEDLQ